MWVAQSRIVQSIKASLYYEIYSEAPCVVMIPDGFETHICYCKNVPDFGQAGYRVSVMDLRGHFQSPYKAGDLSFRNHSGVRILANTALPEGIPQEAALYYGMLSFVWDLLPLTVQNRPDGKIPIDAFGQYGWGGHALRVVPSHVVVFIVFGVGADHEAGFVQRAAIAKK